MFLNTPFRIPSKFISTSPVRFHEWLLNIKKIEQFCWYSRSVNQYFIKKLKTPNKNQHELLKSCFLEHSQHTQNCKFRTKIISDQMTNKRSSKHFGELDSTLLYVWNISKTWSLNLKNCGKSCTKNLVVFRGGFSHS